MKYLVRAAATALVSLGAATGALLPATAATAAAAPAATPLNTSILIGTWTNTDSTTTSVKTIVISKDPAGGILVDAWGACPMSKSMASCEWGNVHPAVFTQLDQAGVDKTVGSAFRAEWSWDHGRANSILAVNLQMMNGMAELSVDEPRIYGQHRHMGPNIDLMEMFARTGDPIATAKHGTSVTDAFPMGTSANVPDGIVGTWTPPRPQPGGFAKIVVSKDRNGTMDVHAWGESATSTSVVSDWGSTYGISFNEGLGMTMGGDAGMYEAIAPYKSHDKMTVLCIEYTDDGPMGGPTILVAEFTNYTPNGHVDVNNPHNFNLNEMFLKH